MSATYREQRDERMESLDLKGDYRSIAIKKEFQRRTIIKQRIRDGDY